MKLLVGQDLGTWKFDLTDTVKHYIASGCVEGLMGFVLPRKSQSTVLLQVFKKSELLTTSVGTHSLPRILLFRERKANPSVVRLPAWNAGYSGLVSQRTMPIDVELTSANIIRRQR